MELKRNFTILAAGTLMSLAAFGQDNVFIMGAPSAGPADRIGFAYQAGAITTKAGAEATWTYQISPPTFDYISTEMSFGKAVTGAPYSAEATTEFTQLLANGNKISRSQTAKMFRDSQGRTRREQTIKAIGAYTSTDAHVVISINDPVAGTAYTLDPATRTASKAMMISADKIQIEKKVAERAHMEMVHVEGGPVQAGGVMSATVRKRGADEAQARNIKSDSLGSQVIEGVRADGTKTTITIPAGQIGNEQPIEIVTETWYSPELQTLVMSKRSDPMNGETVFQLKNIQRDEPAPGLFEVPSDYTMRENRRFELHNK